MNSAGRVSSVEAEPLSRGQFFVSALTADTSSGMDAIFKHLAGGRRQKSIATGQLPIPPLFLSLYSRC
jgi:hypothetical protein